MAYQALYRKYRLASFSDMVGQTHISKTIENAIKSDKISHAYLFSGPRGTGKTSIAKLIARAVNCTGEEVLCGKCPSCIEILNNQTSDIIEIDAASNNGVDEIRDIRDKVKYAPSSCKYKVYIIDETHMLTTQAFNALLKTLEEPPSHVIFILATTEPHKIPLTIISRCQRFDFRKISEEALVSRLKVVIEQEQIAITEEALKLIAYLSDGGMRDALSLLDQVSSYLDKEIESEDIYAVTGVASKDAVENVVKALLTKDKYQLLNVISNLNNQGKDLVKLCDSLVVYFRDALVSANGIKHDLIYQTSDVFSYVSKLQVADLYQFITFLTDVLFKLKTVHNPKIYLEVSLLNLCEEIKDYDFTGDLKVEQSVYLDESLEVKIEQSDNTIENKKQDENLVDEHVNETSMENQVVDNNEILNENAILNSEELHVDNTSQMMNENVEPSSEFEQSNNQTVNINENTVLSSEVEQNSEELHVDNTTQMMNESIEPSSEVEQSNDQTVNINDDNSMIGVTPEVATENEVKVEEPASNDNDIIGDESDEFVITNMDEDLVAEEVVEEQAITPEMEKQYLNYLRGVRINNTLAKANKMVLTSFKEYWQRIAHYDEGLELAHLISILREARLRAATLDHIIISVPTEMTVIKLMSDIEKVEKLGSEILGENVKFGAVSEHEWSRIKEDYKAKIMTGEKYDLIDEQTFGEYFNITNKEDKLIEAANDYFGAENVYVEE